MENVSICKNGHKVSIDALHADNTCVFCGGFVNQPTKGDLRELAVGNWLFYDLNYSSPISGKASQLKAKESKVFVMEKGKIRRIL